jgi:hypothetical protein
VDSVAEPSRREILRQRVDDAKAALLDAANAGVIKNDPLCQHLSALALSVGAHYDIYCAAEEAQREVAESVRRHADTVTLGVLDTVRGSLNTMTKELGPQLLRAALPSMQLALRFMKQRTIYLALGAMVAVIVTSNMFIYAAGLNAGQTRGEEAAPHTIQAAMAAGPDAAITWSILMADNDPVSSMAACRKSIASDADGRRYCFMPVWIDPLARAPP